MGCPTWTYTTKKDPKELLRQAKQAAKEHGIEFEGDERSGKVSGRGVKGWYRVEKGNPTKISIKVTNKPFIVSCGFVKGKMDKAAMKFL